LPGSNAPLLLISDVDDTVKITHVTSKLRAAGRGLLRNAVYAGMAALYQELGAELVFVSGSPQSLEGKLRRTLIDRGGFPQARFVLRNWMRERDLVAFKRQRLWELANETSQVLLLVGDDSEHDPELFLELANRLPAGRVAGVYIRQNIHRALPRGVVPFTTAFELAVMELGQWVP
jgi:phosphatidate phosphatase APP1